MVLSYTRKFTATFCEVILLLGVNFHSCNFSSNKEFSFKFLEGEVRLIFNGLPFSSIVKLAIIVSFSKS